MHSQTMSASEVLDSSLNALEERVAALEFMTQSPSSKSTISTHIQRVERDVAALIAKYPAVTSISKAMALNMTWKYIREPVSDDSEEWDARVAAIAAQSTEIQEMLDISKGIATNKQGIIVPDVYDVTQEDIYELKSALTDAINAYENLTLRSLILSREKLNSILAANEAILRSQNPQVLQKSHQTK